MTALEARKLVAVLIASFPATKANSDTVQIYERMLADLDCAVANAAVERLLATAKFMPTIAEIREACLALAVGEIRAGGDAWGSVMSAMRKAGAYRTPGTDFEFADPVVARCVAALGWQELCLSDNQTADRARFIELYDKLAAQERVRANTSELPAHRRLEAAKQRPALEQPTDAIVLSLADRLSAVPGATRWCAACNDAVPTDRETGRCLECRRREAAS